MISLNATIIIQIINLLVLIAILNRIMFRPLKGMLDKRNEAVQGGLAEAKAATEKAADRKHEYSHQRHVGRTDINKRLQVLREETENKAKVLIAETQDKAREDYRAFNAKVTADMAQTREDIKAEAEAVARSMASLVLGREVS